VITEDATAFGTLAAELRDMAEGKRLLPTHSDAKRHHFVPRMLLRRFADQCRSDGYLWQLDKRTGVVMVCWGPGSDRVPSTPLR